MLYVIALIVAFAAGYASIVAADILVERHYTGPRHSRTTLTLPVVAWLLVALVISAFATALSAIDMSSSFRMPLMTIPMMAGGIWLFWIVSIVKASPAASYRPDCAVRTVAIRAMVQAPTTESEIYGGISGPTQPLRTIPNQRIDAVRVPA